ncbi:MAG: hypothetical protein V1895_03170 [Parcubacteria group bacterium]
MKIQYSTEHGRSAVVIESGDKLVEVLDVAISEHAYYPESDLQEGRHYVLFLPNDPYAYVLSENELRIKFAKLLL